VLLWEEHMVTCFYYILSGQIDVFKLNNGNKIRLSMMNPGAVFGHARVRVKNATRSACAAISMDSYILYIDKNEYLEVHFN
jgi:CRP-like cAMP-binding protein